MTDVVRRHCVLLLLQSAGDRRVLEAALSHDYNVLTQAEELPLDQPFDLCILDPTTLSRNWPRISQLKTREESVFLPFLLLAPVELIDLALDIPVHAVDEVIAVPTQLDRLARRVRILLQLRERTAELRSAKEAYDELTRRYDSQRNIADTLQTALLVLPQSIAGLRFGHLYHSASEAARVGGDFYDLFEVDGHLGILLGDVAGHGLEGAALAALTKNVVKAYALEHESPAEVVARTNTVVEGTTGSEVFVTLFFGLLRRSDGHLTYCTAGQTTPFIVGSDGTQRSLATGQSIVGAFAVAHYADSETVLEPDERLVLYTDGVVEAHRGRELFGDERLAELLRETATTDVEQLPQALFERVLSFTGGRLQDDVAILALSRSV